MSIPENLGDKPSENPKPSSANNSDSETSRDAERGKDGKLLVRGREFNQKKPETFNQLWTPEEQKRLEELLVIYPPEQVEMERFRKIARALGNRTPLQVQSRVQKYFIKLQKAGLPVPGRTYNFTQYSNNRKVIEIIFSVRGLKCFIFFFRILSEWPSSSKKQSFFVPVFYFFCISNSTGLHE